MNPPIPVLLYHRIDDAGLDISITPDAFRAQLALLHRDGWRSLSADEFGWHLENDRPLPQRSFLITFDDGYRSVHDVAFGTLREFGFKAISFMATRMLRAPLHDDGTAHPDPEPEKFMTWEQARALQDSGVIDCQSHSHHHQNFSGYALADIRHDLTTSIDLLTQELRLPRSHFRHLAWPWGLSFPAWRDVATELGFVYQYSVSRQSFRFDMPRNEIPRTCFDATPFAAFQRQLWLQTGSCAPIWDIAYPFGRKLRQFSRLLKKAA